jgi:hypothetical protein
MTYVTIVQTSAQTEVLLLAQLEELRRRGSVGPEALVEEARAEASPLHHLFEWDDSVAGERYRLEQARQYIARVEFVPAPEREPVLVEMPVVHTRAAATSATCLSGVDLTMCSIDRLQAELRDLRRRYAGCAALAPVLEGPVAEAEQALTRVALALDVEPTDEELAERPAFIERRPAPRTGLAGDIDRAITR